MASCCLTDVQTYQLGFLMHKPLLSVLYLTAVKMALMTVAIATSQNPSCPFFPTDSTPIQPLCESPCVCQCR